MLNQKNLDLKQLRDLMKQVTEYWFKSGKYYPRSREIFQALHHSDPFIVHEARLSACLLLKDTMLYH